MKNALRLMELSKNYCISQTTKGVYEITDNESDLACSIDKNNKVTFYVTGCYDSGRDWLDINIERLDMFREFIDKIKEEENDVRRN